MIYSMTGFGKSVCEIADRKVSVEVRSLNSKSLDLSVKVPTLYKEKEIEIRNVIKNKLQRGKIELTVKFDGVGEDAPMRINKDLFGLYYRQLRDLGQTVGYDMNSADLPSIILRFPDVLQNAEECFDVDEWAVVSKAIDEAVDMCNDFRRQEGISMQLDTVKRIGIIQSFVEQIGVYEPNRIERIRLRIGRNMSDFFKDISVDENRFEQELLYYIEKLDITEEKVRLENHCMYFIDELSSAEPIGKKLGFIIQEMGREINTIGSKANDVDIQRIVVQMKDELEKIKEQMMNVL